MAKTFLRSGNLDAVLALGENGQPVYLSALQLRETLRLRKQQKLADCLAIPQANELGDRIDWYAPFSGKVKSWHAASESERQQALTQLENHQQTLMAMSQRALSAEKPAMKLFGALLSKAFQFPDRQYVYLVDGRPVLTFWGFVELDKRSRSDALDCLRTTLQPEPPEDDAPPVITPAPVVTPEPVVVAPAPVAPPAPRPSASVSAYQTVTELNESEEPQIEAAVAPSPQPPRRRRLLWVVPPLVLAVAAALAFSYWPQTPAPVAAVPVKQPQADIKPHVVIPPEMQEKSSQLHKTLPLHHATVVVPPPAPEPVAAAQVEVTPPPAPVAPPAPVPKDALVMPADAVRIGSVRFLDGNWRASLQVKKLPGFKAPTLRYQIRDGKGTATIVQGDGTRCKAETSAGLMSSGNLVINSRYTARCANGTRYKMPQLVCKQGDGAAVCEAQFGSDVTYPISIKRESK
ncbi:SrfA family protein [Mixta intestinalis]|uniref:SrfA n=1 Tax=Mixta intestinalis TaxID=1615494 RepID=A0A6P1PY65_9GAMM|nr:SrfA family protein [Mixta intestinalis]QHM71042.1 hypothetical protein C7M51_01324 [Mixta intestinalis]